MKKRALAFLLVLTMTWSSLGDSLIGFRGIHAAAEKDSPIAGNISPEEQPEEEKKAPETAAGEKPGKKGTNQAAAETETSSEQVVVFSGVEEEPPVDASSADEANSAVTEMIPDTEGMSDSGDTGKQTGLITEQEEKTENQAEIITGQEENPEKEPEPATAQQETEKEKDAAKENREESKSDAVPVITAQRQQTENGDESEEVPAAVEKNVKDADAAAGTDQKTETGTEKGTEVQSASGEYSNPVIVTASVKKQNSAAETDYNPEKEAESETQNVVVIQTEARPKEKTESRAEAGNQSGTGTSSGTNGNSETNELAGDSAVSDAEKQLTESEDTADSAEELPADAEAADGSAEKLPGLTEEAETSAAEPTGEAEELPAETVATNGCTEKLPNLTEEAETSAEEPTGAAEELRAGTEAAAEEAELLTETGAAADGTREIPELAEEAETAAEEEAGAVKELPAIHTEDSAAFTADAEEEAEELPAETEVMADDAEEIPVAAERADAAMEDGPYANEDIPDETAETMIPAVLTAGIGQPVLVPVSLAGAGGEDEEEKEGLTVLETLIEKKLSEKAEAAGKLTGLVQIILNKNTKYEGESTISSRGRTVDDDFVLELAAEDAGEGADGSGFTTIADDLVIKGIRVVMKSVMMAAGTKITLRTGEEDTENENRGSELEYIGAARVINEISVVVGSDSSAVITTGKGNDVIDVVAAGGAESVTVHAGDGENRITATLSSGDAEITSGSGIDNVKVNISGSEGSGIGDVLVNTGAGNDIINVVNDGHSDQHEITEPDEDDETATVTRQAEIRVEAGSGDDNITLDMRSNAGTMVLSTGEGSDTLNVKKGDVNTAEDLSYSENYESYEKTNQNSATVVTVVNGDEGARDQVVIDAAVSRAIRGISLEGGAGASIHLKGELKKGEKPIEKTADGLKLYTSFGEENHSLEILTRQSSEEENKPTYNYTDALKNKKTVALYPQKTGEYVYSAKLEDFTDYILKSPVNGLDKITVVNENSTNPMLSNLVIDLEKTLDGEEEDGEAEKILEIHDVDARPLNLLIKGRAVELQGHVQARNVRVLSVQGTESIQNIMGMDSLSTEEALAKVLNMYDSAEIAVQKNAKIEAEQDIVLQARVKHFGTMFETFKSSSSFNMLNIKVASASVGIEGEMKAGAGSVIADAKVETLTGKRMVKVVGDKTGEIEKAQDKSGDSVGITFVMDDAEMNLADSANVTAGQDVRLRSEGKITVYNFADLQKYVALAITYISNEVSTTVSGKVHAGRTAEFSAKGMVTDDTEASHRADMKDGAINNFLAVNIVDQQVNAKITGGEVTTDRGDVLVIASGDVTAKTIATASSQKTPTKNQVEPASLSKILTGAASALATPITWFFKESAKRIVNAVKPDYYLNKYNKLMKKVAGGDYEFRIITLNEEDKDKGNPSVKPKVAENPDGDAVGLYGVVEPNPAEGYETARVQYRTLEGEKDRRADHYTYKDVQANAQGKYIFQVEEENKSIEVIVTYRKKDDPAPAQPAPQPAEGERQEIDIAAMEDVFDLNHLILEGENGAGEDPDEEDDDDDDHLILRQGERNDLARLRDAGDFVELEDAEGEDPQYHRLNLVQPEDGNRILTWQTFEEKSLKYVHTGQKVRIVGNAVEGKELKSLTVVYVIRDEHDARKDATIVVTPDSLGRFIFEVPKASSREEDNRAIRVLPVFGDKDSTEGPGHTQETGALAVSYVQNKALAFIESARTETIAGNAKNPSSIAENLKTAVIQAGGSVIVTGIHNTSVVTTADGTAVTEESLKKKSEKQEPQYDRKIRWVVPGADYAVRATSSLEGDLSAVTYEEDDSASVTHPKFTITNLVLTDEKQIDPGQSTILLSYYTKFNTNLSTGKRVTREYRLNDDKVRIEDDGTIVFRPDLGEMAVVEGTTLDVSFIFRDADGNGLASGDGASEYAISNPINVVYNVLVEKTDTGKQKLTEVGQLTYAKTEHDEEDGTKYFFAVAPDSSKGYNIQAQGEDFAHTKKSSTENLYASWIGVDGIVHKKALEQEGYAADLSTPLWAFSVDDPAAAIPAGALVTINAVFTEDVREISLNMDDADIPDSDEKKGSAEVDLEEAKAGDSLTVTLNPEKGWAGYGIIISTVMGQELNDNGDKEITYEVNPNGNVKIDMPVLEDENDKLIIKPQFRPRDVTVNGTDVTLKTTADNTGSSVLGYTGELITVSPSEKLTKEGKKIVSITVNGERQEGTTFTITDEYQKNVLVTAEFEDKDYSVGSYTDPKGLGSIEPESGKADKGETVYLQIKPKDGYRAKYGTVMVNLVTDRRTRQFAASWDSDNRYKFTLNLDEDEKVNTISIKGEFEPGDDGVSLSLGIAAALGIVQGESAAEIRGGDITSERGVMLNSFAKRGNTATQAMAGYSKGKTGVAGALGLQIASSGTSAVIREPEYEIRQAQAEADRKKKTGTEVSVSRDRDSVLRIGNGALNLNTMLIQDFGVGGDASNKQKAEASGTGVGAGLAFAIDRITNIAEIEDGVKLARVSPVKASQLTGINLNASLTVKDTVTAKAGAKGGSAWVPVAAVDVYNAETRSRLGKLDFSDWRQNTAGFTEEEKSALAKGLLPVNGSVTVQASSNSKMVQYDHDVTADASAQGGGTAMGGAFVVTWIKNETSAKLDQSLMAGGTTGNVNVSSSAGQALKAVATAAAAGGSAGQKSGGSGSADKQADGILAGAAGLAGRQNNDEQNEILKDVKSRQKAESAESSIAGAGAFVLNMQKNLSRAEIPDGINITAKGKLSVLSRNRTDATIKANASTTKSDTGVGVGVALNIVTMDNIARIGNGTILADELEVKALLAETPTFVRQVEIAEDMSAFRIQMTETIRSAITDWLGDNAAVKFLANAVSKAAASIVDKLINDLNMGQMFELIGDNGLDTFRDVGVLIWEKLKEMPKALASPFLDIYEQTVGVGMNMSEEKMQNLMDDVFNMFTTQLFGDAAGVLRTAVQKSYGSVINSASEMIGKMIKGEGFDMTKLKNTFTSALSNAFSELVDKTVDGIFKRVAVELPLINDTNRRIVKDIYDHSDEIKENLSKGFMNVVKTVFVPYVTQVFRDQVYDYEPVLVKIKESGIKDFIKDELKDLLKEGTSVLTNAMIDDLVGTLDIKPEPIADRHVVITQAISGAGAKTSSGAGSLSIAVTFLTTRAEIGAGDAELTVTGKTEIEAEELRRIRTHATAAVDKRGEADNKAGSGDSADQNTGSANEAMETHKSNDEKVLVTVNSAGGEVRITESEDPTGTLVDLMPAEGYNLKEGQRFNRHWTDHEGLDHDDMVQVFEMEGNYFLSPYQGLKRQELEKLETIQVDVRFAETLRSIPSPEVIDDELMNGGVAVGVEDREPEGNKIQAKPKEVVQVAVKRVKGYQNTIVYEYTENGEKKTVSNVTEPDKFVLISENANERVYGFRMPDADLTLLKVTLGNYSDEQAAADEQMSKTEAKDGNGRSVGVGAAFALTYGKSEVVSQIGQRAEDQEGKDAKDKARTAGISAGTLKLSASSEHEEENFSTAGTDPFEGTSADEKEIGVDASLSINILDNDIFAGLTKGTKATTTGKTGKTETEAAEKARAEEGKDSPKPAKEEENKAEDEPEEIKTLTGDVVISATEISANETKADAFATGSTTAVGASVAVNVSLSDIEARLGSGAEAKGKAAVRSHTLNRDNTWSFASSMGADVQRSLNKFADGVDTAEKNANKLSDGSIWDGVAKNENKTENTETSQRVTDRLNNQKQGDGDRASANLPISVNVLRSQNAQVDNGEDANDQANGEDGALDEMNDLAEDRVGQRVSGQQNPNEKKKVQVAATIGFNLGFHDAKTTVNGDVTAETGDISITAKNAANFRTRATAAAMSLAETTGGGHNIALAVGIGVSKNKALTDVNGDLKAGNGSVLVEADLKQNQTDEYRGYLGVQSVSGSVSGKGYDSSVAGALSLLVSFAESKATVKGAREIEGNSVSVRANDKSKLAIRAGGMNISKGTAVGMGISLGTIWSGNEVKAEMNDGVTVRTDAFQLRARKEIVSFDDFKWPFKATDLLSDSSQIADDRRENIKTGLIDVHKKPGEKSYTIDFNVNSYALMSFVDNLNFLSSQNYYAETVAGSLVTGRADPDKANALNAAGSISLVRARNTVDTILGKNVTIQKKNENAAEMKTEISATGDTNARMIGGGLAVGKAKNSVGVTVTVLWDKDTVNTRVGDNLNLTNGGPVSITSEGTTEAQAFNVAAALSLDAGDGMEQVDSMALGGGINLILMDNKLKTHIGDGAKIQGSSVEVASDADNSLMLISVSAQGAAAGTAAGGTFALIDDDTSAETEIGNSHLITAQSGDVKIRGTAVDRMVSILASASGAGSNTLRGYGDSNGVAGAISLARSQTKGTVKMGTGTAGHGVKAAQGSISIYGDADSRAVNVTLAGAGSKGKAVGLSINGNLYRRESGVNLKGGAGYVLEAGKDVMTSAYGNDTSVILGLAVTAGKELTLSGNLPVLVSSNKVQNEIGQAAITAGGEAAFASRLKDRTVALAGSVAVSVNLESDENNDNAVGATAMLLLKDNTVETKLGTSSVTAGGGSGELYQRMLKENRLTDQEKFTGIYTGALSDDLDVAVEAGVTVAGSKGITVNVLFNFNTNTILADAAKATLKAVNPNGNHAKGGSVLVKAKGDSWQLGLAGGVALGWSNSVGGGLVVMNSGKTVKALARDVHASKNVSVIAENEDDIYELAIGVGGATGTLAFNTQITYQGLKSRVNAITGGNVIAETGEFNLKAVNDTKLFNTAAALVAATSSFAATPVVGISNFTGETNALMGAGTVRAAKGVHITASAPKNIDQYTVGAAAGTANAALSGAFSINLLKDHTNAIVQSGGNITADHLDVSAESNYDMTGVSAAVAATTGNVGGAANVIVSVAKASALAEMEGTAKLNGEARVKAASNRDIINGALTVGGSSGVGVGITVMVLVAGTKMDQDAANMITYGSSKEQKDKTFDPDSLIKKMAAEGVDTSDLTTHTQKDSAHGDSEYQVSGLAGDLAGNGHENNEVSIKGESFDGSSGVLDEKAYMENPQTNVDDSRQAEDTEDISNARSVGTTVYSDDFPDAIAARIGKNAVVHAGGVSVAAEQETKADLFGATVGVGLEIAGVGLSFAIAMLRSNVLASSLGTIDAGNGAVSVTASSRAGEVTAEKGSEEENRNKALEKKLDDGSILTRSIRVVGLAAGIGNVGVGAVGGVARADNITQATLSGTLTRVSSLKVDAEAKYDNVLAATVAVSGGVTAAVGASVAFAIANGDVRANIDGGTSISGRNTDISVTTETVFAARTLAVTAAGSGGGSVTGGVAVSLNSLTQKTGIDRGVTIQTTGENGTLKVRGESSSKASSTLVGLTAGALFGVGIGFAMSSVKPTIETTVGVNGTGETALGRMKDVEVSNDVSSESSSTLAALSAGMVAISGNVLLVFNDTTAKAKMANVSGDLDSLRIAGDLDAKGEGMYLGGSAGGVAVGVSVSYVDVNAENRAELLTDNFTAKVRKAMTVAVNQYNGKQNQAGLAGAKERKSEAIANSVSASVGGVAAGLNAAVARNRARNIANIEGSKGISADTLHLEAYGVGNAEAFMGSAAVGGVAVVGTGTVALNEATSMASMKVKGAMDANLDAHARMEGKTSTETITGSGSIIGVGVNVARVKGETRSIIDVESGKGASKQISVLAENYGRNDVSIESKNQTTGAGVIGSVVGKANSADVYNTSVRLKGNYQLKEADVHTDYATTTKSIVYPSKLGVDASLFRLTYNMADASGNAYVGAELEFADGTISADGDIRVNTRGQSRVDTGVETVKYFAIEGLAISGNASDAELNTKQAALLRLNNAEIKGAKAVQVQSITDQAGTGAAVGASGVDSDPKKGIQIKVGDFSENWATAHNNLQSSAMIIGNGSAKSRISGKTLDVKAAMKDGVKTKAESETKTGLDVVMFTYGGMESTASTTDSFNSGIQGIKGEFSGPVNVNAKNEAYVLAEGSVPGTVALVHGTASAISASVGKDKSAETVKVLIGEDTVIHSASSLLLAAENKGSVKSDFVKKTWFSLASVNDSSIPTKSTYSTGIVIGDKSILSADGGLTLHSGSSGSATSAMDSFGLGLAFDVTIMKGDNTITDDNHIDIGNQVQLISKKDLTLKNASSHQMKATSKVKGYGVVAGDKLESVNNLTRNLGISIGRETELTAREGTMTISSIAGEGDNILSDSYVKSGGLVAIGKAKSVNNVTTSNIISTGEGTRLRAMKDILLTAQSTSRVGSGGKNQIQVPDPGDEEDMELDESVKTEEPDSGDSEAVRASIEQKKKKDAATEAKNDSKPEKENKGETKGDPNAFGIYSHAVVKAGGAGLSAKAEAINRLNNTNLISLNRNETGSVKRSVIQSDDGNIIVRVHNEGLRVKSDTNSDGSSAFGGSNAWSQNDINLGNSIWVDEINLYAMGGKVDLLANNQGDSNTKPYFESYAHGELYALNTSVDSDAILEGFSYNQIKTGNDLGVRTRGQFIHVAKDPRDGVRYFLDAPYNTLYGSGQDKGGKVFAWGGVKHRCDFCVEGKSSAVPMTQVFNKRNTADLLRNAFEKALAPLNDIQRQARNVLASKARYGEEESIRAGEVYALDLAVPLSGDVRLGNTQLKSYRLWTNTDTMLEVWLLPNGTRMYGTKVGEKIRLTYISEVMRGDVLGDGQICEIELIHALPGTAFSDPVIPIGSTGSLNFRKGTLKLLSRSDFELYLHEISAEWFIRKTEEGLFRSILTDPAAAKNFAVNGGDLPAAQKILTGFTEVESTGAWKRYWIGDTPETVTDPEQTLIFLLVNAETDEMDAFRTSARMLREGTEPVDVSLYIYRDGRADRMGEEKYNIIFFDTADGSRSLVKVVTNLLNGRELELPLPLRIVLRAFRLEGAAYPVYSINNHLHAICSASDGIVRMLDGYYLAVCDGKTFESDYLKVTGIQEGELQITLKQGQSVWPELTGEDTAQDLNGNRYERTDGVWHLKEEPKKSEGNAADAV